MEKLREKKKAADNGSNISCFAIIPKTTILRYITTVL